MKATFAKAMALVAMLTLTATQASAQGFLGKLAKGASKLTGSTTSEAPADTAATDTASTVNWDAIPVYKAQVVTLTDDNGQVLTNEDGTPIKRVFLVDQKTGKIRSAEAVAAQQKKINQAVGRILLKVGGGAALGAATGLLAGKKGKGAAIGAAAGAAAGALASIKDIQEARKWKQALKQQQALLDKYKQSFTVEGTPVSADVDMNDLASLGLEFSEESQRSLADIKSVLDSEDFKTGGSTDDWGLPGEDAA